MLRRSVIGPVLMVVLGLLIGCASQGSHNQGIGETTIAGKSVPDAVARTFKSSFPNAEVEKLESEKENGVMVYDFEFREGSTEKECDIAGDGTLLERTVVVNESDVPPAAMNAIRSSAQGAKLGRLEHVDKDYETRDGHAVKLPNRMTQYEVEITKDGKHADLVVTPDGKVVEQPKWATGQND
jgi:uncharacterized membrane protein YkoI